MRFPTHCDGSRRAKLHRKYLSIAFLIWIVTLTQPCVVHPTYRCGVVWCGVVWCGVVWCGVVWCGVVWCGVVWCGVVWCGVPKALLPEGNGRDVYPRVQVNGRGCVCCVRAVCKCVDLGGERGSREDLVVTPVATVLTPGAPAVPPLAPLVGGSMVGSDRLNVPAIDNSSH